MRSYVSILRDNEIRDKYNGYTLVRWDPIERKYHAVPEIPAHGIYLVEPAMRELEILD